MVGKPGNRRDFERMFARHRHELVRARVECERMRDRLDEQLEQLRSETRAIHEVHRAVARGQKPLEAVLRYRDLWGTWPEIVRRRRRPGRDLEAGDPIPVEPRPSPKPLIDGAEAPIE